LLPQTKTPTLSIALISSDTSYLILELLFLRQKNVKMLK
jgi:hypothetical protein